MRKLRITKEAWPLLKAFNISRASLTESYVLTVEIRDGSFVGRGECEPHESDETQMDHVGGLIENIRPEIENGLTRQALQDLLPAGPARNAVDCALWDLEAKTKGTRAWNIAGIGLEKPLVTAYTISINTSEEMAKEAHAHRRKSLLKLKLGTDGSLDFCRA